MASVIWSARTKQMRANGNFSFGTKPKQMSFGNRSTGAKQMRANWNYSFGTKPKQMAFGNWSAGTKQMRANGILTFDTKPKQSKWQKPTTKWALPILDNPVCAMCGTNNLPGPIWGQYFSQICLCTRCLAVKNYDYGPRNCVARV